MERNILVLQPATYARPLMVRGRGDIDGVPFALGQVVGSNEFAVEYMGRVVVVDTKRLCQAAAELIEAAK